MKVSYNSQLAGLFWGRPAHLGLTGVFSGCLRASCPGPPASAPRPGWVTWESSLRPSPSRSSQLEWTLSSPSPDVEDGIFYSSPSLNESLPVPWTPQGLLGPSGSLRVLISRRKGVLPAPASPPPIVALGPPPQGCITQGGSLCSAACPQPYLWASAGPNWKPTSEWQLPVCPWVLEVSYPPAGLDSISGSLFKTLRYLLGLTLPLACHVENCTPIPILPSRGEDFLCWEIGLLGDPLTLTLSQVQEKLVHMDFSYCEGGSNTLFSFLSPRQKWKSLFTQRG